MELKKWVEQLLARIAAMQIPIYAGNASFFLLLSVFPIVSLLLSLLPYTPLTLEHAVRRQKSSVFRTAPESSAAGGRSQQKPPFGQK